MLHPFVKAANCKSEAEFLSKYKNPEDFFKDYPHYNQASLEQNQTLPPNRDSWQSKQFTNVKNTTDRGNDSLPNRQVGGVSGESERNLGVKNNVFKKGGIHIKKSRLIKAQEGLFQGHPNKSAFSGNNGVNTNLPADVIGQRTDIMEQGNPNAAQVQERDSFLNHNVPGVTNPDINSDTNGQNVVNRIKFKYNPEGMNQMISLGNIVSQDIKNRQDMRYQDGQTRLNGITHSSGLNQQGTHGDYDQFGNFRPEQKTPNNPGMFYPQMAKKGGPVGHTWNGDMSTFFQQGGAPQLSPGQIIDVTPEQAQQLQQQGYKIQLVK